MHTIRGCRETKPPVPTAMCVATTPVVLHASTGYFFANCVPPFPPPQVTYLYASATLSQRNVASLPARIPDTQVAATLLHPLYPHLATSDIRQSALSSRACRSANPPIPFLSHNARHAPITATAADTYPLLLPGVSRTISSGVPRCSHSDGLAVPSSSLLQLEARPASQRFRMRPAMERGRPERQQRGLR